MPATKIFLLFCALVWTPYGIFCFFQPSFLEQAAGVAASSSTAVTEIRAMYGGLEAGIGALCILAFLRPALTHPTLIALCFLCGGLALARALGLLIDASASAYTLSALGLEVALTATAGGLAKKAASIEPQPEP